MNVLSNFLFILYKGKNCFNTKSLNLIYSSLIYPNSMCCARVRGSSHKTQLNKITVAQKKIIRIVGGISYRDHSEPIHDRFKIFKFVSVPIYMCILVLFKIRMIGLLLIIIQGILLGLRRKLLYLFRS